MRQNRYRPRSHVSPEQEALPLDTICTILTRQSTAMQAERHLHSAEMNPQELVAAARRLGFVSKRIRVVDADMGIGAYSTVIEDRPGLDTWVHEALPSGASRVVLVSQEDRLFRDRDEIEHNRFIAQVAKYGGWVVCGPVVYNFRREFDRERFRMACKYGREYIEQHIKRRLHPANQRSAMTGRHPGGPVPWGYVVDYDVRSPTFKHYVRYAPHAELVVEHIFRIFARMPYPSTVEVARHWAREGLVWPFFGSEVDARRVRVVEKNCARDEARGGYQFHFRQAHLILTNVAYLGWRARAGELALDEAEQPRVCHEALVDPALFWWCYDHLIAERPAWIAEHLSWAPSHTPISAGGYRPRPLRRRDPAAVPFLAPGRVRCAIHGNVLGTVTYPNGTTLLRCHGNDRFRLASEACSALSAAPVDEALCQAFLEQLTFDERDVRALAQVAERRTVDRQGQVLDMRRQLEEQRAQLQRAKHLALQVGDDGLSGEFLEEARRAWHRIGALERDIAAAGASRDPSAEAWLLAARAATWGERIKATFLEWPREAQVPVLLLALEEGCLGRVDRRAFGVWLRWCGGAESRAIVPTKVDEFTPWSEAEREALRQNYGWLSWGALHAMFPGRTLPAMKREAGRLHLHRSAREAVIGVPPMVFPVPAAGNVMERYGFMAMLDARPPPANGPGADAVRGVVSRQSTRSCS